MNRPAVAWALTFAIAAVAAATPALGDGPRGSVAGAAAAAAGAAAAGQPRPAPRGSVAGAAAAAAGAAAAGQPRPAPGHGPNIITQPAPPFHRAPGHVDGHRNDHRRPGFVFIQPPFFGTRPLGYPYTPYNSYIPYFPYAPYTPYTPYNPYIPYYPYSFYARGRLPAYPAAPSMITDPYYCWVDGIGFSDEGRFAHHLHEVHGVPLDEALASTEPMDGHYVFFGY